MGDTHPTPAENTSELSARLEGREVDPTVLDGDIDERMAALLKDHQEMGARPKQEPVTEDRESVLTPAEKAQLNKPAADDKPAPKKPAKKK